MGPGESAVDFWTELALPGATIDPRYDSGDGIHLNDAGHRILFERMAAKGILAGAEPARRAERRFPADSLPLPR